MIQKLTFVYAWSVLSRLEPSAQSGLPRSLSWELTRNANPDMAQLPWHAHSHRSPSLRKVFTQGRCPGPTHAWGESRKQARVLPSQVPDGTVHTGTCLQGHSGVAGPRALLKLPGWAAATTLSMRHPATSLEARLSFRSHQSSSTMGRPTQPAGCSAGFASGFVVLLGTIRAKRRKKELLWQPRPRDEP